MTRIITGHTGTDHITSDDVSSLQQGLVGVDDYLLSDKPEEFVTTINSNGTIRLPQADVLIQGTHVIVDNDVVEISPGVSGTTRVDSICVKYTCEETVESASIEVVKGTALPPELTKEDIRNGGALRYVALFNVTLNGTTIEKIERVIPYVNSLNALQDLTNALTIKLSELNTSDSKQSETISKINSTIDTLNSTVSTVAANKTFTSPLMISNKGKQDEMMYVDLQTYVSTYDEKTAANDVLAYRIALCDKNHTSKALFVFYSDGNHALTIDGKYYVQPFIQRGYVAVTPKSKISNNVGTVTVDNKSYTVRKDYYENTVTITFDKAYSSTPNIFVQMSTTVGHEAHCNITEAGPKSFKIHLERTTTTSTGVHWVALGNL